MSDFLLSNEMSIRVVSFISIFCLLAISSSFLPKRVLKISRRVRWVSNLGILAINNIVLKILFPILAVGLATLLPQHGWGILNIVNVPFWLAFIIAVVALDLGIFVQHFAFHKIPLLWRMHQVHHSDPEFDLTTGLRFHPFEIIFSMIVKLVLIFLIGPHASVVLIFEIVLNASSMFNHSNVRIEKKSDELLRYFLVTPDMHRIHHSIHISESNSNYGFCLTFWDRLFRTYKHLPQDGHQTMSVGTKSFQEPKDLRLNRILLQPFKISPQ